MRKTGINKTCPACGALFYVQKWRADTALYCSIPCLVKLRPKRERKKIACVCAHCNEPYQVDLHRKDKTRFCSLRCNRLAATLKNRIATLEQVVTGFKKCSVCESIKPRVEFPPREDSVDGLRGECFVCYSEKNRHWREENRDKKLESDRAYYAKNADILKANSKEYYEKNKPVMRAKNKEWREKNLESQRARSRQRRVEKGDIVRADRRQHYRDNQPIYVAQARAREKRIKQATPPWADLKAIEQFYVNAAEATRITGIKHHVDHFYPIKSPVMCGFHVEANLRVIPAELNLAKSNRIIDDDANARCCAWPLG